MPNWPINHGVTTSIYYRDPGQQPRRAADRQFRDAAGTWTAISKARLSVKNPVGVTYDPEDLCRRYEAGEPMAGIQYPPMPEGKSPWDMLAGH